MLRSFDLPGAMASFVVGSYVAFTLKDVSLQYVVPVANQFRTAMASNPSFTRASPEMRRKMYDELAFHALTMGGSARRALNEKTDPSWRAGLQKAARENLEKIFDVPAEQIQLTTNGVVLRQ